VFGYQGRWVFVDLTSRHVRVESADPDACRDYLGGRGLQARILHDHLREAGRVTDPMAPTNRIVIGSAAANDTPVPTAGRGSCSFVGSMTRSAEPAPWTMTHEPVYGLLTHSSAGGLFPNMLKRAGIDQVIVDGAADRPVRLVAANGSVQVVDAEDDLFETVAGRRVVRRTPAVIDRLSRRHPGSSTVCVGPAGWNRVAFACLTNDHHRNFGRGGAGAVLGSKNLVAITATGRQQAAMAVPDAFARLARDVDALVASHVRDPERTASFRPSTGTTWWLDRAFNGGYQGQRGGYLPYHNFDEGYFDPEEFSRVSTAAFLEISGRHRVCNRCRHVTCTRAAEIASGPYAGRGVRPEFETIALWINCCVLDRDAIFHANRLCNELGIDTMTFGSVLSAAMELKEQGFLRQVDDGPSFGSAPDMLRTLEAVAYRSGDIGALLGQPGDRVIAEVAAAHPAADASAIARCVTYAFGGLGYAGIEPKAFPGMFTAYSTSNRGRGDHTYAWTIQAEEGGLQGSGTVAAYVATGQIGKALIDSLGLCDFFTEDLFSEQFLALYGALTGTIYSPETLEACARRICALERHVNCLQGRARAYDAYIPQKLTEPLREGPLQGRAVDPAFHLAALDAFYAQHGWTSEGRVDPRRLAELGIVP
jgi:aldehyde:ferredoxin oxidoreductase